MVDNVVFMNKIVYNMQYSLFSACAFSPSNICVIITYSVCPHYLIKWIKQIFLTITIYIVLSLHIHVFVTQLIFYIKHNS